MSNRVYLYCTNFEGLPTEEQSEEFFSMIGTEYEAAARIPLFWMCLFSEDDIQLSAGADAGTGDAAHPQRMDDGNDGSEGDEDDDFYDEEDGDDEDRPHAYLSCERATGIARLRQRSAMLRPALGAERHALYEEWIARIEAEPWRHILVKTAELDMMSEAGELEQELRRCYQDLAGLDARQSWQMTPAMLNLAGLDPESALDELPGWALAGSANSAMRWPPELEQPPGKIPAASTAPLRPERPWWMFWK
ncbi:MULTISPECIES: hypothetical protein [Herbaspirillum]|uniref:Uncharacterized protein n=1 Tax=Herbaspirillum aquaticum TaxID=568783 RepID=A0A225SMC9_9BURK|nr:MULTISPECIES: hypothetical protein [Herbaspirillum]MRT31142.1 hypothetical protein [Herbaspirillum sp. CAH-3]OWY32233.1 hypothetical protein CEJ45_22265 [Herbaspirillum aquaticum]